MPFVARCACGFEITGDCTENAYILAGEPRHLAIEDGRIVCCRPLQVTPVSVRAFGYRHVPVAHEKERAVVWRDPRTGTVAYPARNDSPMPQRYREAGYERHELGTLRELDRFERANNVVNEKGHYDSNGRGYDGSF